MPAKPVNQLQRRRTVQDTCGYLEPSPDAFYDVDRALSRFLMARDPKFLANSVAATARNKAYQARKRELQ